VVDGSGDAEAREEQDHGHHLRQPDADLTAGDGPVPLRGVLAVGVDVEGVVEEIGAAGGEAEGDERHCGAEDLVGVREDPGGAGGGDDEQVLQPLLRAGGAEERHRHGGARRLARCLLRRSHRR